MHDHDGDVELLVTLKQIGVDFRKSRELNFYFLFHSEEQANNARKLLEQKKLEVDIMKLDVPWWKSLFVKPDWSVSVTQTMALDEGKIKNLTTQFQQIAKQCGGEYDGWEADVSGDNISAN